MRKSISLFPSLLICSVLVLCGVTLTAGSQGAAATTPTRFGFPPTGTVVTTPAAAKMVTITLQQTALQSRDIAATIQNGEAKTLKVADHEANCTVLTLQMQVNGNWVNVALCKSQTPLKVVEIAVSASLAVDFGTKALDAGTAWAPGTYRLLLQFTLGTSPAPGPTDILYETYSDAFTLS